MIGEINDVDGMSGGYNLQACMSEAFIAVRDIIG
jgi:predicted flavoprotein YhiN